MLLVGWEREKGRIRKIPGPSLSKSGKSRKNWESPKKDKKDKKGRTSPDREPLPVWNPPFSGPWIQKRPDVHEIALSIKSRSLPPPQKKCQFWGCYTDLYSFSLILGPFRGGGGCKTKLCGQEFYGHPDFSDLWTSWCCEHFVLKIAWAIMSIQHVSETFNIAEPNEGLWFSLWRTIGVPVAQWGLDSDTSNEVV